MPTTTRNGVTLEFASVGTGPTVVLIPDACVGPWMWAWVLADLAGPHHVVTYAPRGCDGSDQAPDSGVNASGDGYSIENQVADVEAILGAIDAPRVHLVGIGFGGQIALKYAFDHGRARSLTLLGTGVAPAFDDELLETLCRAGPIDSLTPYLGNGLDRLDTEQVRTWRDRDDPPSSVREHQLAASMRFDSPPLHDITLPTRVLHGNADAVWSVTGGRELATALPTASFETVIDAPHLLPVATPTVIADEIAAMVTSDRGQ